MLELKYPSQRLAYPYLATVVVLFLIQVAYGLVIALQQVDPLFLQGILNFNVGRATHVNLAVLWVLTGVIGTLIFVGPLLGGRELVHGRLTRGLLVVIWALVAWNAFSLRFAMLGEAGWAFGQPWLQEGLEYLEAGRLTDVLLWTGFVAAGYIVLRVFPNVRQWNELHWALAIGLAGLVVFWLFGMFFIPAIDLQEFFRWFVVHYWVEGIWEILYAGLAGFMLYALFGGNLRVIGWAVFWSVALVALTGIIGNGHHYFWIGTPALWQFWGSLLSALEPFPMILGIWHVFTQPRPGVRAEGNRAAFYFLFGSSLLELAGAGILGFTQTFALTNVWEHGTWITPAHAHLAFFGTFGMLVLAAVYAVIPSILGRPGFDDRLSRTAFWLIFAGILGIALSFALGGTIQVYIYRMLGIDYFGPVVRPAMDTWKALLFICGLVFAAGVIALAVDLLTLKPRHAESRTVKPLPPRETWWNRPLTAFKMGLWLAALWMIGLVLTLALVVNNLPGVRAGDFTLPYLLAGIGYPALAAVTFALAVRFLHACNP